MSLLPEETWKLMLKSMSIPCVDVVVISDDGYALFGRRTIPPGEGTWTMIGGRILRGEEPLAAARRHAKKHGLNCGSLVFAGVFASHFGWREDVIICYLAPGVHASAGTLVGGEEFGGFVWRREGNNPSPMVSVVEKEVAAAWTRYALLKSGTG